MAVYETITVEQTRSAVQARDLRLGFDLKDEFCAAVWNALNNPIKMALACQFQPQSTNILDRKALRITPEVQKVFEGIIDFAVRGESARIGADYPEELRNTRNVERLIAGCVEHDHLAYAEFLRPHNPFA